MYFAQLKLLDKNTFFLQWQTLKRSDDIIDFDINDNDNTICSENPALKEVENALCDSDFWSKIEP